MKDGRVARRYAQALFETAQKYDVVKSVEEDLNAIDSLLENDKEFRNFFLAPHTGRAEKVAIAEKLFSDRVTAVSMQLLRLMLEKGREAEVQSVREEFSKLRRELENSTLATVTSATALDANQKRELLDQLAKANGKKFEAEFFVDPRLIGGVRVAFESYVLDGSVRGALAALREKLRHDVLKQA
jgi:F-type H+-transporting ATPase subunit delta